MIPFRHTANLSLAAMAILLMTSPSWAQNNTDVLETFLKKAEASDLICQIPSASGSITGQPTTLDIEIATLSDADRRRLRPVLDEMKRLQRLDCARLHLCRLKASAIALRLAQESLSLNETWIDRTRQLEKANPGLKELPIQSKQLAAELRRADNEHEQRQSRVQDATAAYAIEGLAIQAISGLPEQSVSILEGQLSVDVGEWTHVTESTYVPRPDLQLKILMSRTLFPQTSEPVAGWAKKAVLEEVFRAAQIYAEQKAASDKAGAALYDAGRNADQWPSPPIEGLAGVSADLNWLVYGFQRGAVPAADLLWALRNLTELIDANAQARAALGTAASDLACASGVAVRSHLKPVQ